MDDKECCKWCQYCFNTDIKQNHGHCYLDIGEYIENTNNECCNFYRFDENLDRS